MYMNDQWCSDNNTKECSLLFSVHILPINKVGLYRSCTPIVEKHTSLGAAGWRVSEGFTSRTSVCILPDLSDIISCWNPEHPQITHSFASSNQLHIYIYNWYMIHFFFHRDTPRGKCISYPLNRNCFVIRFHMPLPHGIAIHYIHTKSLDPQCIFTRFLFYYLLLLKLLASFFFLNSFITIWCTEWWTNARYR